MRKSAAVAAKDEAAAACYAAREESEREGGRRLNDSGWRRHRRQKFGVGLVFGQAADQKFHGFDGRERAQDFAQDPDAAELVGRKEKFVLTGAGTLDIDGREDALV